MISIKIIVLFESFQNAQILSNKVFIFYLILIKFRKLYIKTGKKNLNGTTTIFLQKKLRVTDEKKEYFKSGGNKMKKRKNNMKKLITIEIIALFIGLSITPGIVSNPIDTLNVVSSDPMVVDNVE